MTGKGLYSMPITAQYNNALCQVHCFDIEFKILIAPVHFNLKTNNPHPPRCSRSVYRQ
jgi:hypothetical protein